MINTFLVQPLFSYVFFSEWNEIGTNDIYTNPLRMPPTQPLSENETIMKIEM